MVREAAEKTDKDRALALLGQIERAAAKLKDIDVGASKAFTDLVKVERTRIDPPEVDETTPPVPTVQHATLEEAQAAAALAAVAAEDNAVAKVETVIAASKNNKKTKPGTVENAEAPTAALD